MSGGFRAGVVGGDRQERDAKRMGVNAHRNKRHAETGGGDATALAKFSVAHESGGLLRGCAKHRPFDVGPNFFASNFATASGCLAFDQRAVFRWHPVL